MWQITEADVGAFASGVMLLGSGGGGEAWMAIPLLRRALREHGPVTVLGLDELSPGSHAVLVASCGSSVVVSEKPPEGGELVRAVREVELRSGVNADAIVAFQCSGHPAMMAVLAAAQLNLPLVDADAVGRAASELSQTMLTVTGLGLFPMTFTNEKGVSLVVDGVGLDGTERVRRLAVSVLDGWALLAGRPFSTAEMGQGMLPGTFRMAYELGRIIHEGEREELTAHFGTRTLFRGKVVEVRRRIFRQLAAGTVVIEHADDPDRVMRIEMQSEYLIAVEDGRTVACVPDLICLVEHETRACLTTERLRYGLWVDVLGIPCFPQWRSEAGLAVFGPRAFGYDLDYAAMDEEG